MLAMSVFAIKDAVASVVITKIPILDAPATPENILMSIKEIKNRKMKTLWRIIKIMLRAIQLSIESSKKGGPFGCVIVKQNKIISEGFNKLPQQMIQRLMEK